MERTVMKNTSKGHAPGIIFGIIMLIIFTLAQGAHAADWPMFRHDPQHTGTSEEVVAPPLGLLWKYTTGGGVWSSPAVSGGVVYVGSDDSILYAFDARTGSLKWKLTTGITIDSSPAISGGVVYIGSNNGNVFALDAATGALKWNYATGNMVSSSPSVSDGVVFVGSFDGNVYALDATTGALKWNYTTGDWVRSSPAISGGLIYVGSYDGNVYALDAATGALKWNYKTGSIVWSSPAVSDGVVYVGSLNGNVYALDATTGSPKWIYTTGSYVESSPAVSEGVVYVGSDDGNVYALDAATGALKRNYKTGSRVVSPPTVSGGNIYVGSWDKNVYALDAATGALKWNYTTGDWVESSSAVSGGVVYVGSHDHNLYAFAPLSIPPSIIGFSPPTPISDVAGNTREFNITTDQVVNVTWLINGTQIQTNMSVTSAKYANTRATQGNWNVTAIAQNANGSAMHTWTWIVTAAKKVKATIDMDPNTLNLKSKGKWITTYIELPSGYDVKKINLSTIKLTTPSGKVVPVDPTAPATFGNYDGDRISDLMVKFNRANVIANLVAGNKVKLTITGKLKDGTAFEGNDTIRVIK